jgi:hypothetical protein
MPRPVTLGIAVLMTIGAGTAPEAVAQRSSFVITPFVGGYLPMKALGELDVPLSGVFTTVTAELKTGAAFGGKLTYASPGRFGAEGTFFYATSKTRISIGALGREDDASVQGGSLKATFRATDGRTETDLFLSAGVSGQSRSGDVFRLSQAEDQFDLGGVVGLGVQLRLSPQVIFRLDGDLSFYQWNWRGSIPNTGQLDILITAGLGLKIGR